MLTPMVSPLMAYGPVYFEMLAKEVSIKPVVDFFSLKGSVKTDKPFSIEGMEKAVEDAIVIEYGKKLN